MESYNIGTRRLLGSLFRHHQKHRRWHYGITLPQSNPNSLSSLLSLEQRDCNELLCALGLATLMKDGKTLQIKTNRWENLIIQEGLEG
jgi:hypothetical protein